MFNWQGAVKVYMDALNISIDDLEIKSLDTSS